MTENIFQTVQCGHCYNISRMEIVGSVSDLEEFDDSNWEPNWGIPPEQGIIYSVLKCPACSKNNIVTYYWSNRWEDEDHGDVKYEILYPVNENVPLGLPPNILKAFSAAEKTKPIDVNAYAILVRRLLELVCLDRKATGKNLALMLQDLANKNEIPEKLVSVAKGLKDFGNIGAHAGSGELSENEVPIVNALSTAILEYIYSAPHLASEAEMKLKAIKSKKISH